MKYTKHTWIATRIRKIHQVQSGLEKIYYLMLENLQMKLILLLTIPHLVLLL